MEQTANAQRLRLITERLQAALATTQIHVEDQSHLHAGHAAAKAHGGGHFRVHLISEQFNNKNPVARHKMVYAALSDVMGTDIHALSIVAQTPQEAITQQSKK